MSVVGGDPRIEISRSVLQEVFGPPAERGFAVRFWDGTLDAPEGDGRSAFTLVLQWPGALRSMLFPPTDRSVGEAYASGEIDFVGDVEAAVRIGWSRLKEVAFPGGWIRLAREFRKLPSSGASVRLGERPRAFDAPRTRRPHSRPRDRRAIVHHYDLGNVFYRLFLDRRMQYSCAYFREGDESLDEAQEAKLERICRRLGLRSGHTLLDVGCGWGGLALLAARRFGVEVTGITLSERQAAWARRAAREAGLDDRCRFEVRDYRDLEGEARFDRIVSVGMIEHVGLSRYPSYFSTLRRLLVPGGLLLNQGIVHLRRGHTRRDRLRLRIQRRWGSFFHRYIFPDSDLVPPGRTLAAAEAQGFELRTVDNLREHYAETLRRWLGRLEKRWNEAVEEVGAPTVRAWRFYMGASAGLFQHGYLGLVQTVLARPSGPIPGSCPRRSGARESRRGRRGASGSGSADRPGGRSRSPAPGAGSTGS